MALDSEPLFCRINIKSATALSPTPPPRLDEFLTISDTSLRKKARQGSTSHPKSSRTSWHSPAVSVNLGGRQVADDSASAVLSPAPSAVSPVPTPPSGLAVEDSRRELEPPDTPFSWWLQQTGEEILSYCGCRGAL